MVKEQLKLQSETNPTHTILGRVIDYFEVPDGGFYIIYSIDDQFDYIRDLIWSGMSAGLSLTTSPINESTVMPYEVSLCHDPKRPNCYTMSSFESLDDALRYKRALISGDIPDASEQLQRPSRVPYIIMTDKDPKLTVASANSNPYMSALEAIPDEASRKLLATRFVDMSKAEMEQQQRITELEQQKGKLEEDLTIASKNSVNEKVKANMLQAQFDVIRARLGEKACKDYHLEHQVVEKAIGGRDYDELAIVTERALMACSRTFTDIITKDSEEKRSAPQQLTPDMVNDIEQAYLGTPNDAMQTELTVASNAARPMSDEDHLRRAMANTRERFTAQAQQEAHRAALGMSA